MKLKTGDWVMHCAHGLGQIVGIEEQVHNGNTGIYYMVKVTDLTIWVPDDENLSNRLRIPSTKSEFDKTVNILLSKPDVLSRDRRERSMQLTAIIKDGRAESLCRVIRDLQVLRGTKVWNEYDSAIFKRAQDTLIGEWSYVDSITVYEAQKELNKLLSSKQN